MRQFLRWCSEEKLWIVQVIVPPTLNDAYIYKIDEDDKKFLKKSQKALEGLNKKLNPRIWLIIQTNQHSSGIVAKINSCTFILLNNSSKSVLNLETTSCNSFLFASVMVLYK